MPQFCCFHQTLTVNFLTSQGFFGCVAKVAACPLPRIVSSLTVVLSRKLAQRNRPTCTMTMLMCVNNEYLVPTNDIEHSHANATH